MKYILILAAVLSCGQSPKSTGKWMNGSELFTICIGGVQYYKWQQGFAPAYRRDGKLKWCEESEAENGR